MRHTAFALAGCLGLWAALPHPASLAETHLQIPLEEPFTTEFEELRVGVTGVSCYTMPCPWNGVARNELPISPSSVIWSGDTPPPLDASIEEADRIHQAYREGCLLIEGRFIDGVLEVREMLGECWP